MGDLSDRMCDQEGITSGRGLLVTRCRGSLCQRQAAFCVVSVNGATWGVTLLAVHLRVVRTAGSVWSASGSILRRIHR